MPEPTRGSLDPLGEPELRKRQERSQRAFFRMLGSASPGARLIELAGIQATVVPARPWFSIFNSVFYSDAASLRTALPELGDEYAHAGVNAWSVWVPPGDHEAPGVLEAAGHVLDSTPMLMAGPIAAIDLESRTELQLVDRPTWEEVASCNDRAHGVLEPWSMAAVFEDADDPASHLYAASDGGEVVSALIAREQDGDCYFWFVATVPEAQGQGLASELMRHALREAQGRGCTTATLESTRAGEPVYARLGFVPLERFGMWERRDSI